ncbi:hypothetical protein OOZ15_12960 [Galbibacter sp. EGI 63066]|uniref:hypothetical protein n=1 Tax=Galbibacter sp. EGI 63066 TaxID=2993559 RepID=UPI002248A54B|nr:hypothetical protein [Galbibacter sp. EGI 63066]MCX2680857.1 hypothetical protein [Galbibacter sp. EGI 63066]
MDTASKINKRIDKLPESILVELDKYLDYLLFKHDYLEDEDWANSLSEEQAAYIQKGEDDIENGRVVPHSEAIKKMKDYLNEKIK